uniref:CMP/dCMP-type deaminase domain-containing protein n=1 Tax=Pristionchus pacificus TaxID=54126 RepID=A0A8R1YPP1_PRIPA
MLSRVVPLLRSSSSLRPLPLSIRRSLHKGVDSTPPLRFVPVGEKLGLYLLICVTFLAYPTSVLLRLNDLRSPVANELNSDVQDQINAIREAKRSKI